VTQSFKWPELPDMLHERQPWGKPDIEPSLCELLADPLLRSLMRSDGVTSAELESAISRTRQRLRQDHAPPPAPERSGESGAKESPAETSASLLKPPITG
jgi:hypothetical protein